MAKSFDLVAAMQRMFLRAEAADDYSGAASVARVLRDITPAPEPKGADGFDVAALTDGEFEELGLLLAPLERFKARVLARLGTARAPAPHLPPLEDPEVKAISPGGSVVTCRQGQHSYRGDPLVG